MIQAASLGSLEYVVVDVETTGSSAARGHRITEICAVLLDGRGAELDEFRTLVNPQRPIPPTITRLTNITDSMVRDAPTFDDIAHDLFERLSGRVFVAHNVGFDWRFVCREMEGSIGRRPRGARTLCTVRMARRLVPEVRSKSLDALCYFFDLENEARHRAYGDARTTAELFRRLMERVAERELDDWKALEEYLKARPKKRKKRTFLPVSMEFPESI